MSVELHNALCGYCRRKLWESSQHQHVQLGTTACQTGSIQVMANTPVNKETTSAHLKEKKTFTPKCRSYLLSNKEAAHNRTDKFQWFPSVKEKRKSCAAHSSPTKKCAWTASTAKCNLSLHTKTKLWIVCGCMWNFHEENLNLLSHCVQLLHNKLRRKTQKACH